MNVMAWVLRPVAINRRSAWLGRAPSAARSRMPSGPHHGERPRRTASTRDRVQGGSVRMAPQPGLEERRDVLFLRDPRILVAHMFEEEQLTGWPQHARSHRRGNRTCIKQTERSIACNQAPAASASRN